MADRMFLGIPLTPGGATELSRQLHSACPDGLPGREVPPDNWHLTLRFLGDVPADSAARLRGALGAGGLGKPFHVAFGAFGAFPDPRRARVLWAGVTDGSEPLGRLAEAVEDVCIGSACPRRNAPSPPTSPFRGFANRRTCAHSSRQRPRPMSTYR